VKQDDPITMYLNDVFTVPANLAGIPGISVPAGLSSDGLPLGLQVLAGAFCEEKMYQVAQVIETQSGFSGAPQRAAGRANS
jgi:aspartyl-tRNA(Asn)/glutamyl-tRNA(Gln) amidotransferase subunit A